MAGSISAEKEQPRKRKKKKPISKGRKTEKAKNPEEDHKELYAEQVQEILALNHIYFPIYVDRPGHLKKAHLPSDLMSKEEYNEKNKELTAAVVPIEMNDEIDEESCVKVCIFFNYDNDLPKYRISFTFDSKYPYSYPNIYLHMSRALSKEQTTHLSLNVKKICAKNYGRITLFDICIYSNEYFNKLLSHNFENLWEEMKHRMDDRSRGKHSLHQQASKCSDRKDVVESMTGGTATGGIALGSGISGGTLPAGAAGLWSYSSEYFRTHKGGATWLEDEKRREAELGDSSFSLDDRRNARNSSCGTHGSMKGSRSASSNGSNCASAHVVAPQRKPLHPPCERRSGHPGERYYDMAPTEGRFFRNIHESNSISGFSSINSCVFGAEEEHLNNFTKKKKEKKTQVRKISEDDELNGLKEKTLESNEQRPIPHGNGRLKHFQILKKTKISYYRNKLLVRHNIDTNMYIIHTYAILGVFDFLAFFLNHLLHCNRGFNLFCNLGEKNGEQQQTAANTANATNAGNLADNVKKRKKKKKNEKNEKLFTDFLKDINEFRTQRNSAKLCDPSCLDYFCSEYELYARKHCLMSTENEKTLLHALNELNFARLKKVVKHFRMVQKMNLKKIIREILRLTKIQHKYLARYHVSWSQREHVELNEDLGDNRNLCRVFEMVKMLILSRVFRNYEVGNGHAVGATEAKDTHLCRQDQAKRIEDLFQKVRSRDNCESEQSRGEKEKGKKKKREIMEGSSSAARNIDSESTNKRKSTLDDTSNEKEKGKKDTQGDNPKLSRTERMLNQKIKFIQRLTSKKEKKNDVLYVQCEYCKGEILEKEIKKKIFQNNKYLIWTVFRQILECLSYLHKRDIYLKNLTTGNMFVHVDEYGIHIKIVNYTACNLIGYIYFYSSSYERNCSYMANFLRNFYREEERGSHGGNHQDNHRGDSPQGRDTSERSRRIGHKPGEETLHAETAQQSTKADKGVSQAQGGTTDTLEEETKGSFFAHMKNHIRKKLLEDQKNYSTKSETSQKPKEQNEFYTHSYNQHLYNCLAKRKYSYEELDLFSLGLVLYEMLHVPFTSPKEKMINLRNMIVKRTFPEDFVKNAGDDGAVKVLKFILINTTSDYLGKEPLGRLQYSDISNLSAKTDDWKWSPHIAASNSNDARLASQGRKKTKKKNFLSVDSYKKEVLYCKGKSPLAGEEMEEEKAEAKEKDKTDLSGNDDEDETHKISAEHLLNCPLIPMVIQRDLFKYFLQKLKINSPVECKNVLTVLLKKKEANEEKLMGTNRNVMAYANVRTYEYDVISSYVFDHISTVLSKKNTTHSHPLAFLLHPGRGGSPRIEQTTVDNNFAQKIPTNFIKKMEVQKRRSAKGENKVYYSNYGPAGRGQNNSQHGAQHSGKHDDQHSDDQQSSEQGDIPIGPDVDVQESEGRPPSNGPPWETKKKTEEEKNYPVLNRSNQRIVFIDKNNKLLYVPFYLTESYMNAIPHSTQGKNFSSSFFFSQNHFLQRGRQEEMVRRENSVLYSSVVRVDSRGDLHFGASTVGGARKVSGTRKVNSANHVNNTGDATSYAHRSNRGSESEGGDPATVQETDVNLSFCVYQLMTLHNVLSILHRFEHYLGKLTIKWSCTHMLMQIIRDVLFIDEDEKARFILTQLRQPNIKYKHFKKLLYFLNLTYDDRVLKILYSIVVDTSDNLKQKMHKVKKMYFMLDHQNKNAISYLASTVIYLESLFEHFNTSKNTFLWDFFMSEYEQVFSFSFAFAVYPDVDRTALLSIGGVSTDAFSHSAERPPNEATYNFVYEIFVDTISALILQKVRKNNCANMHIDFHSPSVVITTKAYKLLVYAFSLYNSLIQNGIKCECKISPLVETSKFEQGLLKYSDINIHVQITQKVNSNTSLNIEDYEGSAETITSNIVGEENVNIMYSTHIIRLNIKKNFENESSLINYIKQFYAKR
ncbi:Serine/threonine protein kinase [Plasmodium coatneyi]|uniref:Serine/threonine protein kinase n=1 Tax=Plasmodium coatneyi TaxID=208452 RepID=A0A1B1E1Z0_9APIC|nr:Serine/threonine protein kinase [Plasmodium coatneyi]ANQ08970.1 Serine/threonine protein kinase [Plasmodium coatneyi]